MKHMLQIEVRGLTLTEAQTARDYLKAQAALHPTWGEKSFSGALDEMTGEIVLRASVRFDSLAGMGDIRDKAKAWLATKPHASGHIHYHACLHDEDPPTPCVDIVKEWG